MGLQQRIFGKAGAGLVGFRQAKFTCRYRLDTIRRQQGADFTDLACIMAGDDQLAGFEFAVSHKCLPQLKIRRPSAGWGPSRASVLHDRRDRLQPALERRLRIT